MRLIPEIKGRRLLWVGALLAVAITAILAFRAGNVTHMLRIHIINVGYGDCILIRMPGDKTCLIDAGEYAYTPRILQYLSLEKIRKIDAVMISHPHTNHFDGMWGVLNLFSVGQVIINGDLNTEGSYLPLLEQIKKRGISLRVVKAGDRLEGLSGKISLSFLHPDRLSGPANDNSLVVLLKYKKVSVLFTGDIGEAVQEKLLQNPTPLKSVNILQIPHHGGPVSERFAKHFKNTVFFISTGKNPWGIPREEDLQKFIGPVWRTDRHGTILIETDGKHITMEPHGHSPWFLSK